MRLIDVDETIKSLEKYDSFMGEPLTERDAHLVECVLALFDSQPTAYSVEAVVRKLREMDELIIGEDSPSKGIYVRKEHAIAIIKRGGRDDG